MKILDNFLLTVIVAMCFSRALSQPGPNWAGILNYNKPLMSKNNVHESLCITIEGGDAQGVFRDVYRKDGLMDTCYDYSFVIVENKVRIFIARAVFDYFEDSVRVRGAQGADFVVEVDSVEIDKWKEYLKLMPAEWIDNYAFKYGKDAEGFYRYEGDRTYTPEGKLARISKSFKDELQWEKIFIYENGKLIREDRYKKTYFEGYKKELEVHYTYTATGQPDSSYTVQLVDFGGKSDTTLAGVIRKHYDKKDRLTVETTIAEGRVKTVTTYHYDINETTEFKAEVRDYRNYLMEERIYSAGGLEMGKKAFDKVYGMVGESRSEYIEFTK